MTLIVENIIKKMIASKDRVALALTVSFIKYT